MTAALDLAAAIPDRRSYIGGADIAAIAGLDPRRSALDVYLRKVGLVDEQFTSEAMDWGIHLEPVVAQAYAEREGVELERGNFWRGPREYLGGTPDYTVAARRRGLEVKTAGYRMAHEWGDEGTDDVPERYLAQIHWYMEITQFSRWDLAALIGGQELRVYQFKRDADFGGTLRELAERFWRDHVLKKAPPAPDGSEAARVALCKLYPKDTRPMLPATPDLAELYANLHAARASSDLAEGIKRSAENAIKAAIGDAAGIEGDGWRVTYKAAKDSQKVDVDALCAHPAVAPLLERFTKTVPGSRRLLVSNNRKEK